MNKQCPRCGRPLSHPLFPDGIHMRVGWLDLHVCFVCVQTFLTTTDTPVVEEVKRRGRPPKANGPRRHSPATRRKLKEAWARRKAAKQENENKESQES